MNVTTDIKKEVRNIFSCSCLLLVCVTFCWFYEPIAQAPMPSKLANFLLVLLMLLPVSIIINTRSILKKWDRR